MEIALPLSMNITRKLLLQRKCYQLFKQFKSLLTNVTFVREQREPLALDIAPDGRVFWVDRGGTLRIYKPDTATVVTSARFPVTNDVEDGLLGIALDANFEETNWIYVYYSPPTPVENRLSRFTMDGDNVLWDSEVILLSIPVQRIECCHSGSLEFLLLLKIYCLTNP